ncbi:MAG: hypothetical protein ACTSUO_08305 [Candidatus Thorarchaeota archaeon]
MPRKFLILFDELPINAIDVKKGNNPPEVIVACRCVNVALFISNNLRRDVILSISIGKRNDLRLISFPGETLRRVSPDERSISFFLLKSIDVLTNLGMGENRTLNNGIVVRRLSLEQVEEEWNPSQVYIASTEPYSIGTNSELDSEGVFVYDFSSELSINPDQSIALPRPSTPERYILDVNRWFDEKLP